MQEVENQEAGYREVTRFFLENTGIRIVGTTEINQGRYSICKTNEGNFMVMFKRDFFHNFGRELVNQGATGMGESVNVEDLKKSLSLDVEKLYFIYPNGAIYSIGLTNFLINSIKWINKENKEIRSISIHKLKRENKYEM